MKWSALVPELTVSNFEKSLKFYVDSLGFEICFQRENPSFAYLQLGEAQLMIEEFHEGGWNTADLKPPFGRGINLQIEVTNIEKMYESLSSKNKVFRSLKESTYETKEGKETQKEFLIQDPDGYLLRFIEAVPSGRF